MSRKVFAFFGLAGLLELSATPVLAENVTSATVSPGCSSYTIDLTASGLFPETIVVLSWTITGYPTTISGSTTFQPIAATHDTGPLTRAVGPFTTGGPFTFSGTASLSRGGVVKNTISITFSPSSITCAPPTNKCPLTQGFWKNHPQAWPVANLTLGSKTYTEAELRVILMTPATGDASLILAHQLIAADLNIANGSNPAPVSATIADANSLLSKFSGKLPYNVSPSSGIGAQMVSDSITLDNYNRDTSTPGCTP